MSDENDERIGAQMFTVQTTVRQISTVTTALQDICSNRCALGPHVRFKELANNDPDFHPKLGAIIREQWKAEEDQVAIPIVDMTMAGLELKIVHNEVNQTVCQVLVKQAGLLSLENTNSSSHSGRFLAVVWTSLIDETKSRIDNAL